MKTPGRRWAERRARRGRQKPAPKLREGYWMIIGPVALLALAFVLGWILLR